MIGPFLLALQTPGGKPVHPGRKPIPGVSDDRPVTAREAASAFDRVANLFHRADGASLGATSIPPLDRPATRTEIVAEMDRFLRAAEPILRFTPAPERHDPSVFRIEADERIALDRLVTVGCVAKIGPLAVGPSTGLTPSQFGDAMGFFVARLAQMSHLPSPKWTPMLQKG